MPWRPLPQIAFAVAVYPFQPSAPDDLPLELGDELYIIEQGGKDGSWYRGYLVAPPSLLAGLSSVKGQTLEARVFSGIFPRNCVEVRELLGEDKPTLRSQDGDREREHGGDMPAIVSALGTEHWTNGMANYNTLKELRTSGDVGSDTARLANGVRRTMSGASRSESGYLSVSRSLSRRKSGRRKEDRMQKGLSDRTLHREALQRSIISPSPLSNAPTRDPRAPKPPAPVPMLKVGDETPTCFQEPLVDEIASCLREWHSTYLHELLLAQQYRSLNSLWKLVKKLDFSRRQLLHNVLTDSELVSLRETVVWDLVSGNKLLGGDVVVRDPAQRGRILTGDDSIVNLSELQSLMSLLGERPMPQAEPTTLQHLLVNLKAIMGFSPQPSAVVFFICSKAPGTPPVPISEAYMVEGPNNVSTSDLRHLGAMRTLFTNLGARDSTDGSTADSELYLVIKVQGTETISRQAYAGSSSGTPPSREGSFTGRYAFGKKPSFSDQGGSVRSGRRSMMWAQRGPSMSHKSRPNQQGVRSRSDKGERSASTGNADSAQSAELLTATHSTASEPESEVVNVPITRTKGLGVLRITGYLREENDMEQVVQIWTTSEQQNGSDQFNEDLPEILSDLLDKRPGQPVTPTGKVQIQLHSFIRSDVNTLVKNTPTLLYNVTRTERMGYSGMLGKEQAGVYLTLVQPFLPSHALLSHPKSGYASLPSNMDLSNLLLTLEVRNTAGERIENCVFPSSNSTGLSIWQSTVVEAGNSWNEVIKLVLTSDLVPHCHVMMTLSNPAYEPFAVGWMPLWDAQAFLKDGDHSILLKKWDETNITSTSSDVDSRGYLSPPWLSSETGDVSRGENSRTPPRAVLRLRSYLCSTVLTQDQVILNLRTWRDKTSEELRQLLKMVAFIPDIEIVKHLREVLDGLFSVLVDQNGNDEFEDLVFEALVTVVGLVHDRRFNIGPLVDDYVKTKFSYPFVAPSLIRSFTRLFICSAELDMSRKLRATFKVGHYMFEFIVRARQQQEAKEEGIGLTTTRPNFVRELRPIFQALEDLMKTPAPILVGSQTLATQNFHRWIRVLSGLVPLREVVQITIEFIDSCAHVKGKLILFKLLLIQSCSRMNQFFDLAARRILIFNTVRWLAPYWGMTSALTEQWQDQVRLCCSILSLQLSDLDQEEVSNYVSKVVDSYTMIASASRMKKRNFSLLFPRTHPFPTKTIQEEVFFDEALIELSAILAGMLNLSPSIRLHAPRVEQSDFLSRLLKVHVSVLHCEAFPSTWISLYIYHHLSAMKTLEYVASVLINSYLPDPDDAESFNTELWRAFFTTLLTLVTSDALALETFPEQKRRAVWKIAGDVREQGAELLRRAWDAIGWETNAEERRWYGLERMGGYQVQYVPGLVSPVIELCLSVHEGLRNVGVRVLQTMIVSEWTLNQDLSVLQAEMIDSLDQVFKRRHMTEIAGQKLFIRELTNLFDPISATPSDPLNPVFQGLLDIADEFIDLIFAVHSADNVGEATDIMHTLQLMEFLKDMRKEDIFIRYVHQLAQIQVQSRNFTEAGLALRHHAEFYPWDPTKRVGALLDPEFPDQTAFERKERLYFDMLRHFEEGKSWHLALTTYQELTEQYENNIFDFAKLARTQRAMSNIHEAIAKGDRYHPRYFHVWFKGLGFSAALRDKQFIYEGQPSERLSGFADRMQRQHPAAQLISGNEPEDIEGQFMQISAVAVHRDIYHLVFQRPRIPHPIREHVLTATPNRFASPSRKFSGDDSQHHHHHQQQQQQQRVERTLYNTADEFPTILKRSEVIASEDISVSPVQAAIERTVRKTQELVVLEQRVTKSSASTPSILLDTLALSIDPSSEASIGRYRIMYLDDSEGPQETEDAHEEVYSDPLQKALKVAMIDHASVMKRCLQWLSSNSSPEDLDHLRDVLQNFEMTFGNGFTPSSALNNDTIPPHPLTMPTSPGLDDDGNSREQTAASSAPALEQAEPNRSKGPREVVAPTRREKNRVSLNFLKRPTHDNNSGVDSKATNSHRQHPTQDDDGDDDPSAPSPGQSRSKSGGGGGGNRKSLITKPAPENNNELTRSQSRGSSSVGGRSTSSQQQRPATGSSNFEMLTSSVESVRKRLSMLRMGRKNSKASVGVGIVQEE
ncbi:MAG: hypothetical protein M1816_001654 [Peltula sp. TS41687]|nr:MAG: hypothetical protein M1816_001654 [Peltula sp. TS41687]